ncbi:hypothetical protein Tco_0603114 [Tanacetum coccineum]
MALRAVLMKTGLKSVNTARPVKYVKSVKLIIREVVYEAFVGIFWKAKQRSEKGKRPGMIDKQLQVRMVEWVNLLWEASVLLGRKKVEFIGIDDKGANDFRMYIMMRVEDLWKHLGKGEKVIVYVATSDRFFEGLAWLNVRIERDGLKMMDRDVIVSLIWAKVHWESKCRCCTVSEEEVSEAKNEFEIVLR